MKKIYQVLDTSTGHFEWCLKKDLANVINSVEAHLKGHRLDDMGLNIKDATPDDINALNDWVSDSIETNLFEHEEELIEFLN